MNQSNNERIQTIFEELGFQKPTENQLCNICSGGVDIEDKNINNLREVLTIYKNFNLIPDMTNQPNFDQLVYFLWSRRIFTPYFDYDPAIVGDILFDWAEFELEDDENPCKNRRANFSEMEAMLPLTYTVEKYINYFDTLFLEKYFKNEIHKLEQNIPSNKRARTRYNQKLRDAQKQMEINNQYNNMKLQQWFKVKFENREQFFADIRKFPIYKLYALLVFFDNELEGKFPHKKGFQRFVFGSTDDSDSDSSSSSGSSSS
jgi:hypothetical protein